MFKKFGGPGWELYMQWPNVIEAIANCTIPDDSISRWGGRDSTCWNQLDCALSAADASQQAQYSSAATILGLLPTVLSMMATSSNELLRIHHRYPILAFLLALCNPSTILSGLTSAHRPDQINQARIMLHSLPSSKLQARFDKYSFLFPWTNFRIGLTHFTHGLILHAIAGAIATIMLTWAIFLGVRGVIVFACWTWHEPFTWVGVGGLVHLLSAFAWRLCLGPRDNTKPFSRWHWSLSRSGGNLRLKHENFAKFLDLLFQVIGMMNYGYGTVMLSGTSLVSPENALEVFCLMGFASMTSRLLAIWLLEVWPEDAAEWEKAVEEGVVLRDMRTAVDESRENLLKDSRKDHFGMTLYENLEVVR